MRALIIVDVQNDFLPGGALAVPRGNEVIPVINELQKECEVVIASKDWHPKGHVSFATWPPHCLQNSWGAQFPHGLQTERIEKVFYKGEKREIDSYSAFKQMDAYLKERGVNELWIAGLALDYCVKATALEARERGWKTTVMIDGTRAIKDAAATIDELKIAHVEILKKSEQEA